MKIMITGWEVFIPIILVAPAWLLSPEWFAFFFTFVALLCVLVRLGFLNASKVVLGFLYLLGGLLAQEGFQIREMRLAFIGLGVGFMGFLWISRFENQMTRTFMSHNLKWYEGRPRKLQGIQCELIGVGECVLDRLDREGVFVFPLVKTNLSLGKAIQLKLSDSTSAVEVSTRVMRRDQGGLGLKFVFNMESMDNQKRMGDLIERLQGVGYEN